MKEDLSFYYSAMKGGKTTRIFQKIHDLEENGQTVLLIKPKIDTKGNDCIINRKGEQRKIDILLDANDKLLTTNNIESILFCNHIIVVEVANTAKGLNLVVSRSHPGLVRRLFELEVPEIKQGIIEIKGLTREPGSRSKIAVSSNVESVDPVGTCIGPKGMRVQNIINELRGEKIDIIRYSENPAEFITNALSPAKVLSIDIDEEKKSCSIKVPADQLSLAIGKEGQNARLAARLTGWKIDLKPENE